MPVDRRRIPRIIEFGLIKDVGRIIRRDGEHAETKCVLKRFERVGLGQPCGFAHERSGLNLMTFKQVEVVGTEHR